MKNKLFLLVSIVLVIAVIAGCTDVENTLTISQNLNRGLDKLSTTVTRLDTINNSYIANPDIYPATAEVSLILPNNNDAVSNTISNSLTDLMDASTDSTSNDIQKNLDYNELKTTQLATSTKDLTNMLLERVLDKYLTDNSGNKYVCDQSNNYCYPCDNLGNCDTSVCYPCPNGVVDTSTCYNTRDAYKATSKFDSSCANDFINPAEMKKIASKNQDVIASQIGKIVTSDSTFNVEKLSAKSTTEQKNIASNNVQKDAKNRDEVINNNNVANSNNVNNSNATNNSTTNNLGNIAENKTNTSLNENKNSTNRKNRESLLDNLKNNIGKKQNYKQNLIENSTENQKTQRPLDIENVAVENNTNNSRTTNNAKRINNQTANNNMPTRGENAVRRPKLIKRDIADNTNSENNTITENTHPDNAENRTLPKNVSNTLENQNQTTRSVRNSRVDSTMKNVRKTRNNKLENRKEQGNELNSETISQNKNTSPNSSRTAKLNNQNKKQLQTEKISNESLNNTNTETNSKLENNTNVNNNTSNQTRTPYRFIEYTEESFDSDALRYNPRYAKNINVSDATNQLNNYIIKVQKLYAITADAVEANNLLTDYKENVLSTIKDTRELNNQLKDSDVNLNSSQIQAFNNYIKDLKNTTSRLRNTNGQLNNEINNITHNTNTGISTSIDVMNSNYVKILNHLDTRITYHKSALATLEQLKFFLEDITSPESDVQENNDIIDDNTTPEDYEIDKESPSMGPDVAIDDETNQMPIVDDNTQDIVNDNGNIDTNNTVNTNLNNVDDNNNANNDNVINNEKNQNNVQNNNTTSTPETNNNTAVSENNTAGQKNTASLSDKKVDENVKLNPDNKTERDADISFAENKEGINASNNENKNESENKESGLKNIDTFKSNNDKENKKNIKENTDTNTNATNGTDNSGVTGNNNITGGMTGGNGVNMGGNSIPSNPSGAGMGGAAAGGNNNSAYRNSIINQNNLNSDRNVRNANNYYYDENGAMYNANNANQISANQRKNHNNVDTYGYNTMLDTINRGTVNNGINTL